MGSANASVMRTHPAMEKPGTKIHKHKHHAGIVGLAFSTGNFSQDSSCFSASDFDVGQMHSFRRFLAQCG